MIRNIVELLIKNAERIPDTTALIQGKKRLTYRQLLHNVQSMAQTLGKRGINRGDRVLVVIPMSIELYILLLALFYRDAVAVFLDAWAGGKRRDQALDLLNCKGFAGSPKAQLLQLFSQRLRRIPVKMIIRGWRWRGKRRNGEIFSPVTVDPDDTALITFTTGSTGSPKAANRTHRFLLSQHRVLNNHLSPDSGDVEMTTLPIFVLNSLASGTTAVIPAVNPAKPHAVKPEKMIREIEDLSISTVIGSPVFFEKIADYCLARKRTVPVRRIFLGGAPVFPECAEKLGSAFGDAEIEIVYGSTEAEPIAFINASELTTVSKKTDGKGLPVGKPTREISLVIMKINDAPRGELNSDDRAKRKCKCRETGEICVSGDHVLKEYVNCPDAQAENKFHMNGTVWHRTGDAGYLDEDGHLFLMGRVKQRLSYGGGIIFPFAVEMLLKRMEGVQCGTLLQTKGGKNVCVVEPSGKKKLYVSAIETELSRGCKISVDGTFVMPIPRDPRHRSKIDYGKLQQIVEKRIDRP